ncbi:LSM5 [Blepharisma stoltei]|uniref:U6 snRNA-associated Sm-like protein LSm5 n=1 Tax=Blepharisma stoltei TaxID=1481888 RepID=A0AAU9K509_9CILI|nr:unnamed protein product [Blepharisma stoltei]
MAYEGGGSILPLKMLDKCIGQKVWLILRDDREFCGVLKGHDEYFNMVLQEVKEYELVENQRILTTRHSILLNGANILMIVPGSEPDYDS